MHNTPHTKETKTRREKGRVKGKELFEEGKSRSLGRRLL